ncbi:MAG: HIT domain-containing protein [Patescibacteria group bacterium]
MKSDPKYDHLLVYETGHWGVYLHDNQCYLGRMYLWAKREEADDLPGIIYNESLELFANIVTIKRALTSLFKPDRFNWMVLGNVTPHCHMHVIPRYAEKRSFHGLDFIDSNFGGPPFPYDLDFKIGNKRLAKLCQIIKAEMVKVPGK